MGSVNDIIPQGTVNFSINIDVSKSGNGGGGFGRIYSTDTYTTFSVYGRDNGVITIYCNSTTTPLTTTLDIAESAMLTINFVNGNTLEVYKNNIMIESKSLNYVSFPLTSEHLYIGSDGDNDRVLDGKICELDYFTTELNEIEITRLYTGVNGTAARTLPNGTWVPVVDGEADLPVDPSGNVTAIEVMTSSGIETSDVGITGSWTEDVTIIEESEDEDHVYVYANITTSQNSTSGSWEYDVASLNFTYNMSINSDNSNVTGTYHNGTVTLDTGLLNFGDAFNYTLTFDKLTAFTFWTNWISKTATKAVVEYNSSNSNVENDFYLHNMSASSTFDFKYSNGTILVNATSDSNGYLKFDDVGGVTDSYKLINDTYTIEKQSSMVSFVAVVFTGLSFVGLYFANRFRRR
jgi:hypothetical protein